jgi:small subunit ribosomal protein S1
MDDGYWEALLQDIENEPDLPQPKWEADIFSALSGEPTGELSAPGMGQMFRRLIAGPPPDEEVDWQRAAKLLASGETFTITVTGYNRGGLLTEFGCVQGFLPASHLVIPPAPQALAPRMAALAGRIGEKLTVRVAEIDRERRRLILSERLARGNGQAEAVLTSLKPGQLCRGRVTNLCPFGAFVDLGGFEGLIHISELSWGRVGSADEVVRPGDEVETVVLEVNPPEQKISLSLKRLRPDPWQGLEMRYRAGQIVDAVITNVVNFGAFARLEEGLEGLIHVSELAEGSFMHPRNVIHEGDRVRARVLQVDGVKRRIALTLRSTEAVLRPRVEMPISARLPM